jgi:hypothetical protein
MTERLLSAVAIYRINIVSKQFVQRSIGAPCYHNAKQHHYDFIVYRVYERTFHIMNHGYFSPSGSEGLATERRDEAVNSPASYLREPGFDA